ncbi:hypothetical protein ACIFOC_02823 [Leucobacter aridicollis]|uniref:cache domain-containing protein n=1 Tax=Leucobacter aridicollis TaxID=283878 RepID=UPI0021690F63|nr:cache domain-containing protein [Leucobacter aridicollis]MCS3429157.1 hypothetical protein [Leucobacter aridicollis]
MSSDANQLADGIAVVDAFFDGVFAPLEAWMPELERELRAAQRPLTGPALAELTRAGAFGVLDAGERPLYGAGFCGSAAVVGEGNPLAWWQGADRHLLASSTFGPGQAVIDLARLEWFRVPKQTGEPHIAGPFVDYLCSNEITLTSAIPVVVDGEFWGVACADVLVAGIEESLLPSIRGIAGAALVNAHGRVVVSTDPDRETGDRMRGIGADDSEPGDDALLVVRSARYPFALVAPK